MEKKIVLMWLSRLIPTICATSMAGWSITWELSAAIAMGMGGRRTALGDCAEVNDSWRRCVAGQGYPAAGDR
jgi:hypothetical protein